MAGAVAEGGWRRSSAEAIERDLQAVWREAARTGPLSRAVMANLVVFCPRAGAPDLDLTAPLPQLPVEEVVRRHPARVILLHHDPEGCDGVAPIAASVRVVAFGPPEARYGIEEIAIGSACGETALRSVVRGLALGGVPTSVWWTGDVSTGRPLAMTMGRQLLYDSRHWHDVGASIRALAPLLTSSSGLDLADLNWRRLTPVRQALADIPGAHRGAGRPPLGSIRIEHRAGEGALAWLFAGWLSAQASEDGDDRVALAETARLEDDDVLTADLGNERRVRLSPGRVRVEDGKSPSPAVASVPRESDAEAIAAELRTLTQDGGLHDALAALARRFASA